MTSPKRLFGATLRRVGRALTDRIGWREAGRAEYAFATSGIIGQGGGLALRLVVAALALLMLPLALVSLFLPIRPATTGATVGYLAAAAGGAVLGLWWLLRRRPSWRDAIAFVAWSDLLLLVASLTQSGLGRVGATMFLGMVAMLIAFLLGWRVLLLHCLFSAAAVVAATVVTVRVDEIELSELYPVVAPAATIVIALPLVVQCVVEAGRHGLGTVTVERDHDTLTGLHGRRSLDAELRRRLRGDGHRVSVVAVLDLDRFKDFNDAHGHQAGDRRLFDTAQALRAGVRSSVFARMGGDEFLVIGTGTTRDDVDAILGDLRRLVTASESSHGAPLVDGSVGAVVVPRLDPRLLSEAIALADAALSEAKADRALRVVVSDASDASGAVA